ncbi:MAG: membrane protein insertion efficiency factor YidD [Bdellovibrionota bacterium]
MLRIFFWFYQTLVSPAFVVAFGIHCRYEESCSCYFERSIREKGFFYGSLRGFKRLLSCNPWSRHG